MGFYFIGKQQLSVLCWVCSTHSSCLRKQARFWVERPEKLEKLSTCSLPLQDWFTTKAKTSSNCEIKRSNKKRGKSRLCGAVLVFCGCEPLFLSENAEPLPAWFSGCNKFFFAFSKLGESEPWLASHRVEQLDRKVSTEFYLLLVLVWLLQLFSNALAFVYTLALVSQTSALNAATEMWWEIG